MLSTTTTTTTKVTATKQQNNSSSSSNNNNNDANNDCFPLIIGMWGYRLPHTDSTLLVACFQCGFSSSCSSCMCGFTCRDFGMFVCSFVCLLVQCCCWQYFSSSCCALFGVRFLFGILVIIIVVLSLMTSVVFRLSFVYMGCCSCHGCYIAGSTS